MNADKLQGLRRLALGPQAQLDGLLDTRHQLVEGLRLCVATAEGRDRRYVVAVFVPLHDDVKLSRHRNRAAIAACVPRLAAGEILIIFGEGISTDSRRLHTVRKGAMRFGYAAEEAAQFNLGLVWIPVGINYSAKQRFRSNVLIRVGRPFSLADLGAPDSEARALQLGTERLQSQIESLVANIERAELAGLIDRFTELLLNPGASMAARIRSTQHVARAIGYFNTVEPGKLAELSRR